MKLSLLGGSGGLGSILADQLLVRGHDTVSFSRSSSTPFDVTEQVPPEAAFDADAVVYLAWSTRDRSPDVQKQHADAAVRWARRADESGTRFLFVSTVLAGPRASSQYGVHKFVAEAGVQHFGGTCLRVGLVVDDGYPELLSTRLRSFARGRASLAGLVPWGVHPISGQSVAEIVCVEASADAESDGLPVLAAERLPVPLPEILGLPRPSPALSALSTGLALTCRVYPSTRGTLGRHIDALRGLALTEVELDDVRDPRSGPVAAGDWRTGIIEP